MDTQTLQDRLSSVVVTTTTPFETSGEVDLDAVGQQVKFLVDGGIRVLVPGGNTGEFASLRLDEARRVVEVTVEAASGSGALVVAGVGGPSRTAADLARHAAGAGAGAVMVHHPTHPYIDRQALRRYYEEILEATDLGVVVYKRGPELTDALLAELARHERVVAVKYAVGDVNAFANLASSVEAGACVWLCGSAERWAPFFALAGARGFTSGIANFAPTEALALQEALQARDYGRAMELRLRITPFEELRAARSNANNVPAVKEAMAQLGLGSRVVRDPLAELDEADRAEVSRILREWGLLG